MADNSAKMLKEMQKIASNAQIKVQELVNKGNEASFDFNSKEAATSRQWQKEMSDTAHTREVQDLKRAGLNPVLSANQGAQSYTTSSASDHAENAASAYSALAGQRLQGIVGKYQADTSAAAQRAAAATSAAAQRYAASAALAAAREQAAANRYAADKHYEAQKYNSDTQYKIQMQKPQGNPIALADKYLGKYFDNKALNAINKIGKFKDSDFNTPKGGTVTKNNFSLDKQGIIKANNYISKLGISKSSRNQKLVTLAYGFGDKSAFAAIKKQVAANQKKYNQAANNVVNKKSLYW